VVVKQTLTTLINLVNLTLLNQWPVYVIRFLPAKLELWFTIPIASVVFYPEVVLAYMLQACM